MAFEDQNSAKILAGSSKMHREISNFLHIFVIPSLQGLRKVWQSGDVSNNVVGIICPSWLRYTPGGFVWCDRPFYLVKLSQEKWVCDFHDDALPLSFQLQVAEVFF